MREPLTIASLNTQLAKLNAVFTKYKLDDMKQLATGYFEALKDLDEELVKGAVDLAIKQEPRFPVPAKLREYARDVAARTRVSLLPVPVDTNGDPNIVCPTCGSTPRLAWLEGSVYKATRRVGDPVETFQHKRYIAPCNPQRHPVGTGFVPMPPNFIDWVIE